MRSFRKAFLDRYLTEIRECLNKMEPDLEKQLSQMVEMFLEARRNKKTIFIMGNGGSGSTASHFACDLAKGTIASGLTRFRAIALTDNMPQILAWANDTSYENIFVEQLRNLMEEGDIVLGISVSGESLNVIKALEYANEHGAKTIAWTGFGGGKLKDIAKMTIIVPSKSMQCCEDIHLILEHLLTSMIREESLQ